MNIVKNFWGILKRFGLIIVKHKIISGTCLILLIIAGFFGYKHFFGKKSETGYVTAAVQKGTITVSVSGSGQVSVLNQVDIKSDVSGEVVYVGVKKGQEVKAGTLLLQIDTTDAQKAVRDAETSLETAKLELEELLSPPDELTLLQAENSLSNAKESKTKAEDNLTKGYEDGFNDVANAFLELPSIMSGLKDIIFSYDLSKVQENIDYYTDSVKIYDEKVLEYKADVLSKYQIARDSYDQNFQDYKSASRFSEKNVIESLINETYETVKNIAEVIKSTNDLIQFYQDELITYNSTPQALSTTHLSSLSGYISKTNSQLSTLLSTRVSLQTYKDSIVDAERTIEEKELSLADLKAGADKLEIRAKKITIQQKEDALLDAQQSLADCYLYAPFDGVIASVDVKKGDTVSSSAVATIITKQKIAEIALNEVDIAQVKEEQKANITFDAIENLNITGEVAELDTLGTVSQGVVSYTVKVVFDTQDERVKPGMSVSVAIITDMKQDILLVSSSAVKSNGQEYVTVMENNVPRNQTVETGLSNDTMTEITSGLKEGDEVVTQTITSDASSATKSTNGSNSFRMIEGGGGPPGM